MKILARSLILITIFGLSALGENFPFSMQMEVSEDKAAVNESINITFSVTSSEDSEVGMTLSIPESFKTESDTTWSGFLERGNAHVIKVVATSTEAGVFTIYSHSSTSLLYDWFKTSQSKVVVVGDYKPLAGNQTENQKPLDLNLSVKTARNVSRGDYLPVKATVSTNRKAVVDIKVTLGDFTISVVEAKPEDVVVEKHSARWFGDVDRRAYIETILVFAAFGFGHIEITASSEGITKTQGVDIYVGGPSTFVPPKKLINVTPEPVLNESPPVQLPPVREKIKEMEPKPVDLVPVAVVITIVAVPLSYVLLGTIGIIPTRRKKKFVVSADFISRLEEWEVISHLEKIKWETHVVIYTTMYSPPKFIRKKKLKKGEETYVARLRDWYKISAGNAEAIVLTKELKAMLFTDDEAIAKIARQEGVSAKVVFNVREIISSISDKPIEGVTKLQF